jgi:hypothetical protein
MLGNSNSSQPDRILSELEQIAVSGIPAWPGENASQKLNQNTSQGLDQNASASSTVSSPGSQSISSASSPVLPSLSKEKAQEAEVDQWEGWPGKEEPIEAWKPFLKRMGLERGKYEWQQRVQGKAFQRGSPARQKSSSPTLRPTWNFLAYILLSKVPGNRLKVHQLYKLCLAWCPNLGPDTPAIYSHCRHNLTTSTEFARTADGTSDPGDWHRIATEEEQRNAQKLVEKKKLVRQMSELARCKNSGKNSLQSKRLSSRSLHGPKQDPQTKRLPPLP